MSQKAAVMSQRAAVMFRIARPWLDVQGGDRGVRNRFTFWTQGTANRQKLLWKFSNVLQAPTPCSPYLLAT